MLKYVKKTQKGFVLITSLIVLVLVSMMAISIDSRSKTLQKFALSNARYEEISAIADSEINEVIDALSKTKKKIIVGSDLEMDVNSVTKVWNPKNLRSHFSRGGSNRTDFGDFSDEGWKKGKKKSYKTVSGKVVTSLLIEEMVRRKTDESDETSYVSQYLITVMAVSLDDGVNAREKVVLQSVYQKSYGI